MNYFVYHLHSDLSNGITNIDSVTKFESYISRAKELGMTALAFSEHGSLFEWYHKKQSIEGAGMKYVHAIEVYVTDDSKEEKVRDNYHCVLLAKNYDGFLELNKLVSRSFYRDGHFYYTPRIFISELFQTSDNILITTACLGGILGRGVENGSLELVDSFIKFLADNKHRCFLEIQHHDVEKQKTYNLELLKLHKQYGIPLIAGTDTHALNKEHLEGRKILQLSKNIHFDEEDEWDLSFKTYNELLDAYDVQGVVDEAVYLEAIANTLVLADIVEPFKIDTTPKYPQIYENPIETFKRKIWEKMKSHRYALQRYGQDQLVERVKMELDAYIKTGSVNFMLLQYYLRSWEVENGIFCGPARGSVSGSQIAYILGITEMDSMKFNLNFSRFINKDRISMADIDTDYGEADRERVRKFILGDKMNLEYLKTSAIITFNTIAQRGAIRDVGRALEIPLDVVGKICDDAEDENQLEKLKKKFPDLFRYVEIVMGTIVSVGSHPCGIVVSDVDLESNLGLCTLSTSEYPVSMLNMKELDSLNYIKLDILGLDNVALINQTCKLAGIERVTPDSINLEDEKVWKSIRDDTTGIFQWESPFASQYIAKLFSDELIDSIKKQNPNFSYLKWMSFGNGLLRPGSNSYRDDILTGVPYDNGLKELNEFLSPTLGRVCMQEDIMQFLVKFCGYTQSESDTVRRGIAKKKGTEQLLPEIERRFITYTSKEFNISEEKCAEVIKPFLQVIMDASAYAFSWNHSDSYSYIGYACGYLRYYHPLEFISSALNLASGDENRTKMIIDYASKRGIKVLSPIFGLSKSNYYFDKETNSIYKGVSSIKFMSNSVSDELNKLYNENKYEYFSDLLYDITKLTSVNKSQLEILIRLNYFRSFGNINTLLNIYTTFMEIGNSKIIRKISMPAEPIISSIIRRNSKETPQQFALLSPVDIMHEIELYIFSKKIEELSLREMAQTQQEYLGYIDFVTGTKEDRRKLLVVDIEILKTKLGKIWARRVKTHSLGTGKNSEILIFENLFSKNPLYKYDVIFVNEQDFEKKVNGKFTNWYLHGYRKV